MRRPATSFTGAVEAVVGTLAPGEVVSYGWVASAAGRRRAARAVGDVLARSHGLPWWRVVRSDGTLAAPDARDQARRLRAEGVVVEAGKVVLPPPRRP